MFVTILSCGFVALFLRTASGCGGWWILLLEGSGEIRKGVLNGWDALFTLGGAGLPLHLGHPTTLLWLSWSTVFLSLPTFHTHRKQEHNYFCDRVPFDIISTALIGRWRTLHYVFSITSDSLADG